MRNNKKRQIPTIVGSIISCCWIRIAKNGIFDYCIGIIYKWYIWVKSSLEIHMISNRGDRYNEWNRYWWISIMDLIIIDRWRLNKLHMMTWKKCEYEINSDFDFNIISFKSNHQSNYSNIIEWFFINHLLLYHSSIYILIMKSKHSINQLNSFIVSWIYIQIILNNNNSGLLL